MCVLLHYAASMLAELKKLPGLMRFIMNLIRMELQTVPLLINILPWEKVCTVSNIICWIWEPTKTII
jgi:hypothetical protein